MMAKPKALFFTLAAMQAAEKASFDAARQFSPHFKEEMLYDGAGRRKAVMPINTAHYITACHGIRHDTFAYASLR